MASARPRSSLRVKQLLTKAKKAERRGKPHDCADACRRILDEQPGHPKALSLLGLSALQLGDFQVGIESLLQAVAANPGNVSAFINLGKAFMHVGNPEEAEKAFLGALAADPADVEAHLNYAIFLEIGARFNEAKEHYLIVTQKRPRMANAWLGLGNTQKASGDLVEARESYGRAAQLLPKFASAHHNLGSILLELGDNEAAINSFRRTNELEPGRANSWFNLGIALRRVGDFDEAVNALEKARDLAPGDAETHNSLGQTLEKLMRYDEAISCYQQAIEIKPDDIDGYINLGIALKHIGQIDEALSISRHALEINSENAAAFNISANCLSEMGRVEEAAAAYEAALSFSESNLQKAEALCKFSELPNSVINIDLLTLIDEISACDLHCQYAEDSERLHRSLQFARALELDKLGRHKEAWHGLIEINGALNLSNEQGHRNSVEENEDALKTARNWNEIAQETDPALSDNPMSLFIMGPSRSGKSCLEKLLSGLDSVKCGYESPILLNSVLQDVRSAGHANLDRQSQLPDEQGSNAAEKYSLELRSTAGQAKIFTNTSPGHINFVGRIAEIIPSARFIFVHRNMDDIALRIFMRQYNDDTHSYAYKMSNIFNHLSWYQQMADIWIDKLPKTSMALSYEDMVTDPKGSLASIAEFCGLPAPEGNPPDPGDDRGCANPYLEFLKDDRD